MKKVILQFGGRKPIQTHARVGLPPMYANPKMLMMFGKPICTLLYLFIYFTFIFEAPFYVVHCKHMRLSLTMPNLSMFLFILT